jgi:MoaA/NifB/PqqE/SkfB family radical SAM enzyme
MIKRIARKVDVSGLKKSCSLTGGEPSLHSQFFEILEFLALKNFSIFIETNGMNFEKLIKHPLFGLITASRISFLVSLDSYKEKVHDFFRGTGSFKKAIKMLSILKERGNSFSVNTVINRLNNPPTVELENFALFLIKKGAANCIFSPIVTLGRNKGGEHSLTVNEMIDFSSRASVLSNKYKNLINIPTTYGIRDKIFCSKIEETNKALTFSSRGFHPCLYQEECVVCGFKEAFATDFSFVSGLGSLRRAALTGDEYVNGDCWSCSLAFSNFFSKKSFDFTDEQ